MIPAEAEPATGTASLGSNTWPPAITLLQRLDRYVTWNKSSHTYTHANESKSV